MSAPWSAARPALGSWVKIPAPEVIELLALAGLDFVVIDTEHASIGPQTVSTMIALAHGCGIEPFVRVQGHTPRDVQPALDAGAAGLFLPHIDGVDAAVAAASSCRFPPFGTRGASPSGRAGGWGRNGLSAYLSEGNSDVTLVAQLESASALDDATGIAAVEGIDAVFIGPVDLAVCTGLGSQEERLHRIIDAAETACTATDVALGTTTAAGGPEAAELFHRGYQYLVIGSDAAFLTGAAFDVVAGTRIELATARQERLQ